MIKIKDYIRVDTLELMLFAVPNPFSYGYNRVEQIFEVINLHAGELIPDKIGLGKSTREYSISAVRDLLLSKKSNVDIDLSLVRSANPEVIYSFAFMGGESPIGLRLWMVVPMSYFGEAKRSEGRSHSFVSFVSALAKKCKAVYGFAHSEADFSLGTDPHKKSSFAPKQVYEIYWLNVYGTQMIRSLGRHRVLSTPAASIEEFDDGGVLLLTRLNPGDYASDEARFAQARALAHLRDDVSIDEALTLLRDRSIILAPVARDWDPDIEDLLELTLDDVLYAHRQQQTAKLNQYRPPDVTELRPIKDLLVPDVDDIESTTDLYAEYYAERLAALLHKKVPEVMQASAESLPLIDYHIWHFEYSEDFEREDIEQDLVPAIGAYLGEMIVRNLGGRWVPRKKLVEAQVVLGDYAWLPFLRASHYMQSKQSALDYSLTKFYRKVERHLRNFQKKKHKEN